jgi:hypothetical protein
MGGTVRFEGWDYRVGQLGPTESSLTQRRLFARPPEIDLAWTSVTDSDFQRLGSLTNVEYLDLTGSKVGDEGCRQIANLAALRALSLSQTSITDEGLVHLVALTGLERLNLEGTLDTDRGIECLNLLEVEGITTVGEVCDRTADELFVLRNFNDDLLAEIRTKLAAVGVGLRGE